MDADAIARLGALGAVLTAGAKAQQPRKAKATNGKAPEGTTLAEGLGVTLQVAQRALNDTHALEQRVAALESVVETLVQELVARTAKS